MPDSVFAASSEHAIMSERWRLIQDLLGGTMTMRKSGTVWLPMEDGETELRYRARLGRSTLLGMYKNTVAKLGSRPFSKAVTFRKPLPTRIAGIEKNADRRGTNYTKMLRDAFETAINFGLAHVITDFPVAPVGQSLAQEMSTAPSPYIRIVQPPDLLGVRSETAADGTVKPVMLRVREWSTEKDGDYGEKKVERVRVWYPDRWELWTRANGQETIEAQGRHTFGRIPVRTLYFNRTGFMTGEPTMEDLAWLNLEHWQSSSDQKNLLRVARIPILCAAGFADDELKDGLQLGSSKFVRSRNKDANLKFTEHTGKAMEAGRLDIQRIQDDSELLGVAPLVSRTSNSTATGISVDDARATSEIVAWIMATELFSNEVLADAAQWTGEKLDADFATNIFSDFGLSLRAQTEMKSLIDMRRNRDISHRTFLGEAKKRGLLDESVDVDKEIEAVEQEGPSLAEMAALGVDADGKPVGDPAQEGDPEADPKSKAKGKPFGGD